MHEDPASSQIADCVCTTMDSIRLERKKKQDISSQYLFCFLFLALASLAASF